LAGDDVMDRYKLGIIVTSPGDGVFLDVNNEFCRMAGFERNELIGKSPRELGLFSNRDFEISDGSKLQKGRTIRDYTVRLCRRSGDTCPLVCSAEMIEYDSRPAIIASLSEHDERIREDTGGQVTGPIDIAKACDSHMLQTLQDGFSQAFALPCVLCREDGQALTVYAPGDFREETVRKTMFRQVIALATQNADQGGLLVMHDRVLWGVMPVATDGIKQAFWIAGPAVFPDSDVLPVGEIADELGIGQSESARLLDAAPRKTRPEFESALKMIRALARHLADAVRQHTARLEGATRQQEIEEQLRRSEQRFRTLALSAPIGVFQIDTEGQCVYVNERWSAISGVSFDEAMGDGWIAAIHPDDLEAVLTAWHQATDTGEEFSMDYRLQAPSGKITWVVGHAAAVAGDDDSIQGYIGTISDITDRKRTETAMHESERRYRNRFMNAPIGYHSMDELGFLLAVNKAWLNMLGYSEDEVIGHHFSEFITPECDEQFTNNYERLKEYGPVKCPDFEMVGKDGRRILVCVHGRIQRDHHGHFQYTDCILQDITEARRAEEALKASEEKYRMLVDQSPLGVGIVQSEPVRFVFANEAMAGIFGYSLEEFVNLSQKELKDRLHPDDTFVWQRFLDRQSGVHVPESYTYRIRTKDGAEKTVRHSARIIEFKGSLATQIMLLDITNSKQAGSN